MEVILLEKIRNLGNLGDKVRVKAGYGRNFLIPQAKAVAATEDNLAKFEERRAELEEKAAKLLESAEQRASQINALELNIEALASDEGKLYGSVGPNEVSDAIVAAGVQVDRREVNMPEGPIHSVGEYEIEIQVHSDVVARVKLTVDAGK